MRLVAISRIKNEIDIVEAFVRHTAAFVDAHVILDNESTDGTREILEGLAAEGVPIEVVSDPRLGGDESALLTALMRRALSDYAPQWVLPLDVDEFIGGGGRGPFEKALAGSDFPVLVGWRTYAPTPLDDPGEANPVLRIRNRLRSEHRTWEKVFVPAPWVARGHLTPGHHDIALDDGGDSRRTRLPDTPLCHFPVRSLSQYTIKVMMGNLWYVMLGPERNGLGFHYEAPFRQLLDDWDAFRAGFYEAATRFAVEPGAHFEPVLVEEPLTYQGGDLRLTPGPRPNEPWHTLLEYTRQLAEQIGRTRAGGS